MAWAVQRFGASEWQALADGVAQRVRALELFVKDIYADRRIVEAGVVPGNSLDEALHFEPRLD
ncbi:MAG TPA: circularly permuted type 2 ATP-grasp protein [Solirubrobacteraceae bacterium]|jgi:carboxylate-amine ligase